MSQVCTYVPLLVGKVFIDAVRGLQLPVQLDELVHDFVRTELDDSKKLLEGRFSEGPAGRLNEAGVLDAGGRNPLLERVVETMRFERR